MAASEMNIIVVGAGIAVLGAAIVLSRAGHIVTKSHFKEEVGFHIIMGWNATRVLESFGTSTAKEDEAQTLNQHIQWSNPRGRPKLLYHNELKRLALYPGPGKKAPKLMLGQKVISVCIDSASAILEVGEIIAGDPIIGADSDRWLASGLRSWVWPDKNGGPLETDPKKAKTKMLEKFKDYHPKIIASLQTSLRMGSQLLPMSTSRLFKGKALLIGDAAHSQLQMFPTTGRGGSQAIEDIGALSVLFSTNSPSSLLSPYPLTSPTQLIQRLNLLSEIRAECMSLVMGMMFWRLLELERFDGEVMTGVMGVRARL
ncbi:hypothetical protein BDZ45DRAFT_753734 [Acephala macrosclerotiorum]|nr:hypothetical protein BDZ45DRAFT_753734 [Acephala macrosclerotiorum]